MRVEALKKVRSISDTMHPLRFGVHCRLPRASNKIKKPKASYAKMRVEALDLAYPMRFELMTFRVGV